MRTTLKQIEGLVERLNDVMARKHEPWTRENGRNKANIGNFHISQAYGGVSLHEMSNNGGGVRDVFGCGHIPKRDLYDRLHAMLVGIELAKK